MQEPLDLKKELGRIKDPHVNINVDSAIFDPKVDMVFKAIFTQNTKKSEIARLDFLSSMIGRKVVRADVAENELSVTFKGEKESVFDMHLKLDNGDEANVEIQLKNDDDMINRTEFYACKLYASQDAKGSNYANLHNVYEIMITNFTLFKDCKEYTDEYSFRNKNARELPGNVRIIFLELTKLREALKKPVDDMTEKEMWALFLKYANDEKRKELLEKLKEKKEGIAMASEILGTMSHDRAVQLAYLDIYKAEADKISKISYATNKGLERGFKRGEKIGELKMARNMVAKGFSIKDVSLASGFTEKELTRQ